MAQNDDLSLGTGLIRKGEARGISPALAVPPKPESVMVAPSVPEPMPAPVPAPQAAAPAPARAAPAPQPIEDTDPPLRAAPPDDVPKRFTSFRLPVSLDEELRAMMFETRRSKQDLLIEFVTQGVKVWRRDRAKRS